jgi:glycerol-3-phosphate O-acyltransferase
MKTAAKKPLLMSHLTAMVPKLGWMLRILGRLFFSKVAFDDASAEIVRRASRRGTVVYVMRDRSYIDYLFFNWAYVSRGLPLALFAGGLGSIILHPLRMLGRLLLGRGRSSAAGLTETIDNGDSALLFLRKPQTLTVRDPEFRRNYILELIRLQRGRERPILLVPQLLLWSRAPERYKKSLIDVFFGEPDAPGRLRGIWLFLRNHRRAFAKVAEPLDLKEFLERFPGESEEVLVKKVRWVILNYLSRERQVVLGPIMKSPKRICEEVLRQKALRDVIGEVAQAERATPREVEARARKLLREIAAELSIRAIRAYSWILKPVYNRLYDGIEIDEAGLDRIREAMRKMPVILVPCHRSHMDYLLLSYLFFNRGLTPPHIAAGKNLSFWPMGWLFRKGGAFFLRRSFKRDRLYAAVFRGYVQKLLREGFPIEFFIEGSRSRTGKMLFPKLGLLSMVVDAVLSGQVRDIAVVPIHIAYEKIIEGRAYSHELLGGEKEKENLKGLLAVPKVLRARYGRVYLDFAEPISLAAFCGARTNGSSEGTEAGRSVEEQRRTLLRALSMRITFDITRVARAAPQALAAAVLLGEGRRGISRERFLEAAHRLREILRYKHVRLPKALGGPSADAVMDEALRPFQESKLVEIRNQGDTIIYAVPEKARLQLDYYKNAILHAFVAEAIVACALCAEGTPSVSRVRLRNRARKLSRLLKYEFIFRPGIEFDALFDDAMITLERHGFLQGEGGEIRAMPGRRADLRLLSGLIENFIESYAVTARGLQALREAPGAGMSERSLVDKVLEVAQNAYLTGEIRRFEACSKLVFENALRYYRDEGVLAEAPAEEGDTREPAKLTESFTDPEALSAFEAGVRSMLPPLEDPLESSHGERRVAAGAS